MLRHLDSYLSKIITVKRKQKLRIKIKLKWKILMNLVIKKRIKQKKKQCIKVILQRYGKILH